MSKAVKRIAPPKPSLPTPPSTAPAPPTARGAAPPVAAPVVNKKLPKLTKEFLLAGRALFTVSNGRGEHYTFRVRRKEGVYKGQPSVAFFVNVKTDSMPGTRSYKGYSYIGMLNPADGTIKCTQKSVFLPGSKEYDVAKWATTVVIGGKMITDRAEIEHAGKCGRCGLRLTDPVSIKRGIGPDCWENMGHKP